MNQQNIHDHLQTQMLLPWYLNQTLSDEQQRCVEQHLDECLVCRLEWQQLQELAHNVPELPVSASAADLGFAAIRQQLTEKKSSSVVGLFAFGKRQRRRTIALSIAASLLLTLVTFNQVNVNSPVAFHTLSSQATHSSPANSLRVVFSPSLKQSDIEAILQPIHGHISQQANSVGAWSVTLEQDQPSVGEALSWLRQHPDVRFAEPILQP